jgi:UDP-glucuronate 4-epimerase
MQLAESKILLTGGAGFIGSHLAESLVTLGADLTIVDNFDSFYSPDWKRANVEQFKNRVEIIEADICDAESMREVFRRTRPRIVVHLAARAGVRPSIEQPRLYEQVNVYGTLNLLEAAREFPVERFVFGSSSSVYGTTSPVPFSEEQCGLRPVSPYAATKLAAETFCYTYARLYHIAVVCLRFFTVYGPRQRPDLAIHKFTALIEHNLPLPVFELSSGRDYTHVSDILRGILAALTVTIPDCSDAPFEVFNLGNSRPVKLFELIKMLEVITGRTAIVDERGQQAGDVSITWADIRKARHSLGYVPTILLEDGLRDFVSWYRAARPVRRAEPKAPNAN